MPVIVLASLLIVGPLAFLGGAGFAGAAVQLELVTPVASPTYLWNAGDDRLFILERAGRIMIFKPGEGLLPTPFLDISSKVRTEGERGLFAIAFHPNFQTNRLFYVSYYGTQPQTGDIVARYQVSAGNPDVADPASEVIVFNVAKSSGQHNGGQIAIRPTDGHLYLSTGDGGGSNDTSCNAQNGHSLLGKVLRLDITQNLNQPPYHAIPSDNPFVGSADPGDAFRDEIWALGLRNPWRFSFDRLTGDMFIGDVGQDNREETDFEPVTSPGGQNYGWKVMEGTNCKSPSAPGCDIPPPPCFDSAYTPPIAEVPHSENGTCAGMGGFRYRGSAIPELYGKYVFGDYCSARIFALEEIAPGVWGNRQLLVDAGDSLRSFGQDRLGELYALVGNSAFRLVEGTDGVQPLTTGQRTCVNRMNQRGADVLRMRGKLDASCVKLAGNQRLPAGVPTADACLTVDSLTLAKRAAGLQGVESLRCRVPGKPQLVPPFGFTSAGKVGAAARRAANRFTRAIFGDDVQGAVVLATQSPAGAKCQRAVALSAQSLFYGVWKTGLDGKKGHLSGRLGPPVATATELGDRVLQYVQADPGFGRIRRRRDQLAATVVRNCTGQALGPLFPGDCGSAASVGAFAACMVERARCDFCRSFGTFDGLTLDCDAFDDGQNNDSCASEAEALCAQPGTGVNFAAGEADCARLQDYRLFANPADPRSGANGGIPFDLTTPLFSDYALKYRFLFLPPGTHATYDADRPFDFPVGTIIAKTFSFAHDLRNLALGEDVIETRLLVRRELGWEGLAYVWDTGTNEAYLSNAGDDIAVSWIHSDGSPRSTTYHVPSPVECGNCHSSPTLAGDVPIGPKARLLNRTLDYGGGPQNQLDHWSAIGALSGAPPSGSAPRLPFWNNPADGTQQQRALAYLETNCAHCHNPDGLAGFTELDMRYTTPVGPTRGVCQVSGFGGIPALTYNIVPGQSDQSILFFRLSSASQGVRMPPLLKSVVHEEGAALVEAWIDSLTGSCP